METWLKRRLKWLVWRMLNIIVGRSLILLNGGSSMYAPVFYLRRLQKNKYVYISLLNFSILLYLIIGVKIGFFSALVGSFFLAALKRIDYFSILHLYSASLLPRVSLGRSFNGDVLTKNSSFLGENIDHISCLFYIVSPVRHHQLYYNLRQVMKWRMKRRWLYC